MDNELTSHALNIEIMERSEIDLGQELEERLRFETLLAELSTRFINLPSEQIDGVIEDAQRRICDCLDLDLSALWQWTPETPRFLTVTHLHSPPEGPSRPERIDAQQSFPWVLDKMLKGETLVLSTEVLPPEAARDQESRRHFGVKSSVVLPLSVGGGSLIGVLTFDTLRQERHWPVETVQRLELVAQIFCNSLIRKESDKTLRENEIRLALAADSAKAGLWELNYSSNRFWATERALAIFGYDHEEIVTMERFEQSVHPADLERVQKVIAQSLDSREPLSVEYRIHTGGDDIKWVYSSGHPYYKPTGEPDRLLGLSIDITERKAFETELVKSKERLVSAIDIATLGFYEMGEDNHISFLDDRMRDILGIPPEAEAYTPQFWLEHIHPDDQPHVLDATRKVLEEGINHFMVDYRYLHPGHGTRWIHHLSRVLKRDPIGRATNVIGVMQDITDRKDMEEKLQESESTLRHNQKDLQRLAGGLISLKEEELRRLSRELHDDLTQRLAVIAIETGKMEQYLNKMQDAPPELQKISQVKNQLIRISEDVHRISRQLHPTILDDLGLVRAIESECTALQAREDLVIIFRHEDVPDRIPNDISLCIYRIVQEGLNNIINHSGVKRCELCLNCADNILFLTVNDEGSGFDPVEVRNMPGLGLSSMRERVQLVRGDFSIETLPGKGTTLHVSLPLRKSEI